VRHAQQYQQTPADFADCAAINDHAGRSDPLDNGTHRAKTPFWFAFRLAECKETLGGTQAPSEAVMGLDNYTKHQQGIIKRYYDNRDTIALQKLGEQVTDLYLAEGKKRERVWRSIVKSLESLKVPKGRIDTLVTKNDPALVAKIVQELQAK
jgi:hypothetical protein